MKINYSDPNKLAAANALIISVFAVAANILAVYFTGGKPGLWLVLGLDVLLFVIAYAIL